MKHDAPRGRKPAGALPPHIEQSTSLQASTACGSNSTTRTSRTWSGSSDANVRTASSSSFAPSAIGTSPIPVPSAGKATDSQRRASAAFGANYLPLYRYFRSESGVRRLMIPLDSGDGRHTDDYGHDLLYKLYRRRLIELTSSKKRR